MGVGSSKIYELCRSVLLTGLLSILLQACGPVGVAPPTAQTIDPAKNTRANPTPGDTTKDTTSPDEKTVIDIPISIVQNTSLALAGVVNSLNPDSFTVTLGNCSTGLAGTNTNTNTISVYLGDTNCLGKLTSIVIKGQSYLPVGTGSTPFTTWLPGDSAIFVGFGPTDLVRVKVLTQLSSPIVSTDTVAYAFAMLQASSNINVSSTGNPITLATAGINAPAFKINSGDVSLMSISSGVGTFQIKLTCKSGAMTTGAGVNTAYNSYCPDVAGGLYANGATGIDIGPTYFSYKLIADPNGNGTLTFAQAVAAMASGDITVNLNTRILSGASGFQTELLTGPGTMAGNPKLILILQTKDPNNPTVPANSSFQYFPITAPPLNP